MDLTCRLIMMITIATLTGFMNVSAQPVAIEEIRVTADPLSDIDDHLIQPTRVLNKEELKTRSIQNIGETVSRELGVTSSDFGAGSGRPVIRGLSGGRIKILQDNISTMDASTISADHGVTTEPVFARQIEILRGPATLLYGSGASGGLVNVVTGHIPDRIPDQGFEGEAVLQYETVNDGFTGAGAITAGGSNLAIHLSGMKRSTDDYDIPGFAEADADEDEERGTLENSGVDSEMVTGGLSYIGRRGFFGFSVSGLDSKYGIPGGHGHHEEDDDEEEEGGVTIDMNQIRFDFQAALNNPMRGIREIRTRWGYNDYEHDEIEPDGDIGTSFSNEELEGRIEIIHEPLAGWNGVFGVQITDRKFSAVGEEAFVLPSEQDSVAFFLVEKADFGDWHVDVGFRYENVDSKAVTTGDTADHDLFSISGGAAWHYLPGYQLGLSLGLSQRAPSIEELFSDGPHLATNSFDVGDPDLKKETSNSIDLYWRKTEGRYTFTANLFYNRINDFIFLQSQDLNNDGFPDRVEEDFDGDIADILDPDDDDELLLQFHSQADADFYGFELETVITLMDDHRGDLKLRAWTDFVSGELDRGDNLPRISPWRIGSGVDYNRGPLSLTLDYTHIGKQTRTAELEDPTASYNMLNLYAGYDFSYYGANFTLFARATNLLNEEARRHTSFVKNLAPLPGRSGIFGIRAGF